MDTKQNPFSKNTLQKYLVTEEQRKLRYSDISNDSEEVIRYQNLNRITSMGLKFWDGLCIYNSKEKLLTQYQETSAGMIRKALKSASFMSDKLLEKGLIIINLVTEKGISIKQITDLSKLEDKELIDPSELYNRLKRLSDDDWERILDLGEQTKKLSFYEISVLKTVIQKLKRKENIDLKRLQVTQTAINKLKRFGIKT